MRASATNTWRRCLLSSDSNRSELIQQRGHREEEPPLPSFPPLSLANFSFLSWKTAVQWKAAAFQPLPSRYLQSLAAPGLLLESERRVRERRNSIGDYSSEDKPGYSHLALAWQHGLQGGYIIFFFLIPFNLTLITQISARAHKKSQCVCVWEIKALPCQVLAGAAWLDRIQIQIPAKDSAAVTPLAWRLPGSGTSCPPSSPLSPGGNLILPPFLPLPIVLFLSLMTLNS